MAVLDFWEKPEWLIFVLCSDTSNLVFDLAPNDWVTNLSPDLCQVLCSI